MALMVGVLLRGKGKNKKNYHERNENKKNEMKWFLMNGSGLWHISKKKKQKWTKVLFLFTQWYWIE